MIYTNTLSNDGMLHDIKVCGLKMLSFVPFVIEQINVPNFKSIMDI